MKSIRANFDVLGHYQNVDWPYELVDIENFDGNGVHKNTNNLYFLEPQYVFCDSWGNSIEWIPQEVRWRLRERKMALVLWFPHEDLILLKGLRTKVGYYSFICR